MEAAASIVGLLAVGAKVYTTLEQFLSTCSDAPSVAQATRDEVRDFQYALGRLQPYVEQTTEITPLGSAATDVNQLSLTLASCVVTFSQLEMTLDRLLPRPQMDTIGRLRWTMASGSLTQLLMRIQQHKSTITLLLTIWRSESSAQAENSLELLNDLLVQVIAPGKQPQSPPVPMISPLEDPLENEDLPAQNMVQLNAISDTQVLVSPDIAQQNLTTAIHLSTIGEEDDDSPVDQPIDFHSVLFTSRPYKSVNRTDSSAVSLSSSQRLGMKWSLFSGGSNTSVFSLPYTTAFQLSGVKLADALDLNTIPLPVRTKKLYNPWWYCQKGFEENGTFRGGLTARSHNSVNRIASQKLFLDAVKAADMVTVLKTLSQGVDVNTTELDEGRALRIAIEIDNRAMLEFLLDRGAKFCELSYKQRDLSVIISDCISNKRSVKRFMRPTAQRLVTDTLSILHLATEIGNIYAVKILLDRGIGVNETTHFGYSPLHHATAYGHDTIVSLLLDRGAKAGYEQVVPRQGGIMPWSTGCDALCFAVAKGRKDIVLILLENGGLLGQVQLEQLKRPPVLTALQASVLSGNKDMTNLLLDHGADISQLNKGGIDALYTSAACGNEEIVSLLLDRGADVNAILVGGLNALEGGVESGIGAVVRTLLDRGASFSVALS